ncbi:MAG: hypothetical protein LBP40_07750 [Campylobacteraceae bacterium]|jgi:outer membrane murein-binding lipoprotein Lpp|nr:hypothetical protein [Campylobacteraceae bacterium]
MKKSIILGVLAAAVLSFFLTGCESQDEKAARLKAIDDIQTKIQQEETSIQTYNIYIKELEDMLKTTVSEHEKEGIMSDIEALKEDRKINENQIQQYKTKLQEFEK